MGRAVASIGGQAIAAGRRLRVARTLDPARSRALRDVVLVLLASRLVVLAAAIIGARTGASLNRQYDDAVLTHPFGALGNDVFAPLAHWDAVWYLRIAAHGYWGQAQGFFPLYPLVIRLFAFGSRSPDVLLPASYISAWVTFGGALYLLHRLTALELGPAAARATVVVLAFFPGSVWLGAPFSESVFLLVTIGAVYAARLGRWPVAGVAAALASGARPPGLIVAVPLLVIWWRQRPRRHRDLAWIALAPAGIAAFSIYLGAVNGDALAWRHLQTSIWHHHLKLLSGLIDGSNLAWSGLKTMVSGTTLHYGNVSVTPFEGGWLPVEGFLFLAFSLVALAGAIRRLAPQYPAFAGATMASLLSVPVSGLPLMSYGRYVAVIFPLFMWFGLFCSRRPRRLVIAVALSLPLLVFLTVRFATGHWVE